MKNDYQQGKTTQPKPAHDKMQIIAPILHVLPTNDYYGTSTQKPAVH